MERIPVIIAAALLAACAGQSAPVPVRASPADLMSLAGRWEGEYSSAETGRSGSIVFTLDAGRDSATGDVLMTPTGTNQPYRPAPLGETMAPGVEPPAVLTIRFVRVIDGHVIGRLDPYIAPDCNCTVRTTFTGTMQGERISGTYSTTGAIRDVPVTGQWEVRRRPAH